MSNSDAIRLYPDLRHRAGWLARATGRPTTFVLRHPAGLAF